MSGRVRAIAAAALAVAMTAGVATPGLAAGETGHVVVKGAPLDAEALAGGMISILAEMDENAGAQAIAARLHQYLRDAADEAVRQGEGVFSIADSEPAIAEALAKVLESDLTNEQLIAVYSLFQVYTAPDIDPPAAGRAAQAEAVTAPNDPAALTQSRVGGEALGPPPTTLNTGGSDYTLH